MYLIYPLGFLAYLVKSEYDNYLLENANQEHRYSSAVHSVTIPMSGSRGQDMNLIKLSSVEARTSSHVLSRLSMLAQELAMNVHIKNA